MADTPCSQRRVRQSVHATEATDIGGFVATLSHDLRTPLSAVVGWADVLEKGARNHEELERAIETIQRNAHALSAVVSNLLDLLPNLLERGHEARGDHPGDEGKAPLSFDIAEPDLTGVHVLIVEDDPDGNDLVCTVLERYGARVTSAMTAGAALDLLAFANDPPHILVSDIGLPDMDGIALIQCLRERASEATLPAVALTAYATREDARKVLAAGFDAHVAKPVKPATLGRIVSSALRRSGERRDHARPFGCVLRQ